MRERIIIFSIFMLAAACAFAKEACKSSDKLTIEQILTKITEKTDKLESFTSNIVYSLTEDPEIFETTTSYTGNFRYLKTETRQYAMLEFNARKQDEFPIEKYRQTYIFDGVWLTRIDFPLKQINRDQIAEENEPQDVFKLLSEDFPLIGFSGADKLADDYEIKLSEAKGGLYSLVLDAKEDANVAYGDIEFVIDSRDFLPRTIKATSTSDNSVCVIELDSVAVNENLTEKVFNIDMPEDFTISERKIE